MNIFKNYFVPKRGFTLIELLVVIAIIGLLSSVVLASMNTARQKARDAARISDIRQIQTAIEMYASDNGHYPITTAGKWTAFDPGGVYHANTISSPDAATINDALKPYISGVHDPINQTGDGGYLYNGKSDGRSYCVLIWRTPENMNDFPASMIPPARCPAGVCPAGGHAIYVGVGAYQNGC